MDFKQTRANKIIYVNKISAASLSRLIKLGYTVIITSSKEGGLV
jgi:hypothetical protein